MSAQTDEQGRLYETKSVRSTGGRGFGYQSIPLHSSPLAKTDLIPSLISDRITSDLLEPSLSAMSSTNRMTFFCSRNATNSLGLPFGDLMYLCFTDLSKMARYDLSGVV